MLRRSLRLASSCALVACVVAACSSGGGDRESEKVAAKREAITGACSLLVVGAPCDPGTGHECDGECSITAGTGGTTVTCTPTSSLTANDGKVCGTAADRTSDCAKACAGHDCITVPATVTDGNTCKPSDGGFSRICDGVCEAGTCNRRSTFCPFDTNTTDCVYNFCNAKTGACTDISHPAGGTCSVTGGSQCHDYACNDTGTCMDKGPSPVTKGCFTGSACTTGDHCDGSGTCTGTPVTCSTSMPCHTASCDPTAGCVTTPTSGGSCTPTSKCFLDGTCASGACKGTTPKDCSSHDPCTIDGCVDATGACTHRPKCTAPDACHISACDAVSGACSTSAKNCDDGDPCTTDGCSLPSGACTHTPIAGCSDAGTDSATTDSGTTIDSGTNVDSGTAKDSGTTSDTGSMDTGGDSSGSLDGAGVDGGDDTGIDNSGDLNLKSGCGCRTAGDGSSTDALRVLGIAAVAAVVVARRRRRA